MNLKYTEGCICTSYDVDGTEFVDIDNNRQRELAIQLINYANNYFVFEKIYSLSLEDNDELYDMNDEELDAYYHNVDKLIEEFEKEWTPEKRKQYCIDYITKYDINDSNSGWLYQYVYQTVLEYEGKYEDLGHCSCCGDHIREYTLTI